MSEPSIREMIDGDLELKDVIRLSCMTLSMVHEGWDASDTRRLTDLLYTAAYAGANIALDSLLKERNRGVRETGGESPTREPGKLSGSESPAPTSTSLNGDNPPNPRGTDPMEAGKGTVPAEGTDDNPPDRN